MELVRVTESAALAASKWVGRGDKNAADGAAVDAMRNLLDTVNMDGIVVIGEGEKDEAPMLFNGEHVGNGSKPVTDVAVDPIDGTTLTSQGRGNALSVIAVAERGSMFSPGPFVYMNKIAVGPDARGAIDVTKSVRHNLDAIARAKHKTLGELTIVVLDRPRHDDLVGEIRAA
ncbi:MAG: fructose-bisphosphatase class II family protein, partial [Actinomycetota bacterium]